MLFDETTKAQEEVYQGRVPESEKVAIVLLEPLVERFITQLEKFYEGSARVEIKCKEKQNVIPELEFQAWWAEAKPHYINHYMQPMEDLEIQVRNAGLLDKAFNAAKERGITYGNSRRKFQPDYVG